MHNVHVPNIEVTVAVDGQAIADICFYRVDRSPAEWEITAAIEHPDCRTAVRACLLASAAELLTGDWIPYTVEAESGGETDDQLQLPWE